jgi:ubiquinone biosynthesis monooxygenase Coq7
MIERPVPAKPGAGASSARLAEILRVDHAGELGAVHIYRGQRAVFEASPSHGAFAGRLGELEAHEARHLARFEALLAERRVRPTLMAPFWRAAGFALGATTALMGVKATHACTEAVESVIEAHYAGQVAEMAERDPGLAAELAEFREEELAHRDEALQEGAREAPGYGLLSAVIRAGCKTAIKVSERI